MGKDKVTEASRVPEKYVQGGFYDIVWIWAFVLNLLSRELKRANLDVKKITMASVLEQTAVGHGYKQ